MNKHLARIAFVASALQVLVILVSWLVTAAMPELSLRSLLSGEGVRWFFGQFVANLSSPLLIWMILLAIAIGSVRSVGLVSSLLHYKDCNFRERFAIKVVMGELVLFIGVMAALTLIPHALLLSVSGTLLNSSFSRSLIPCISFALCAFATSYGTLVGKFRSITDVFEMLVQGLSTAVPYIILYILLMELYCCIAFVFQVPY